MNKIKQGDVAGVILTIHRFDLVKINGKVAFEKLGTREHVCKYMRCA
jgi:hypothetical protein